MEVHVRDSMQIKVTRDERTMHLNLRERDEGIWPFIIYGYQVCTLASLWPDNPRARQEYSNSSLSRTWVETGHIPVAHGSYKYYVWSTSQGILIEVVRLGT